MKNVIGAFTLGFVLPDNLSIRRRSPFVQPAHLFWVNPCEIHQEGCERSKPTRGQWMNPEACPNTLALQNRFGFIAEHHLQHSNANRYTPRNRAFWPHLALCFFESSINLLQIG